MQLLQLTPESYQLLRDSPFTDSLSAFKIDREPGRLRFRRKKDDYSLFFLDYNPSKNPKVQLQGLDGYGLQDKVFMNEINKLLMQIKLRENEISD